MMGATPLEIAMLSFGRVKNTQMQLDVTTGHLTPVVVGIGKASALQDPHGMLFVTQ